MSSQEHYDAYIDQLNDYYLKLERKLATRKLGHKQFSKSLEKLDEWEEQFVEKYNVEFEEEL